MPPNPSGKLVKGRFKSEEEIIAAIDAKLAQVKKLRIDAASLNIRARDAHLKFEKKGDPKFLGLRDKLHERSDRKILHAEKLEKGYLTHLKGKLAVFRTDLLPEMGTDRSIPK